MINFLFTLMIWLFMAMYAVFGVMWLIEGDWKPAVGVLLMTALFLWMLFGRDPTKPREQPQRPAERPANPEKRR